MAPRRTLFLAIASILVAVVAFTICYNKDTLTVQPNGHDVVAKKNRFLPSLENGGIVFFLHIPKTGGTTIRELVKFRKRGRRSRVNYIYLTGLNEYDSTVESMKGWVVHGPGVVNGQAGTSGAVVFIEYHALDRNCPTFLQMSKTVLPQWRRLAKENNVPFFAFAILREPISMAISFFNFYHGIPQNPKRFDLLVSDKTRSNVEELFVNAAVGNPQCLFLARNEDAYTKTGQDLRDSLTHDDCHQAYSSINQQFDWVGTTDTIRNETLPLLKDLFQTNQYTKRLIRNLNKTANKAEGRAPIHLSDLSVKTLEHVRSRTVWDQEMYDSVRKDFSYESWRQAKSS